MKIVTPSEMRELDSLATRRYKIPALALMENAGRAVADQAMALAGGRAPGAAPSVCIVCGPGNNGGDGFVAARLLHEQGIAVSVFLLGRAAALRNQARVNCQRVKKLGLKVDELTTAKSVAGLPGKLAASDVIVDAVFGTGFRGAPDTITAEAISAINGSGIPVLAVDIPSGINGETGAAAGAAVRARCTVTLGLAKTGLLFHPGKANAGEVIVVDIGLPQQLLDSHEATHETVEGVDAVAVLPFRRPDAHKGSCGTVFALAGSLGFTGAAALTAQAALRSGAGLVYLGVPESLHDVMAVKLTEVIIRPLPETRTRTVSIHALERIRALLPKADALAIGPGLSTHPETVDLVQQLLPLLPVPAVIDADGLNALSQKIDALGAAKVPLILTPHYGELSRLLQIDIAAIKASPPAAAREAARRFRQVVVLKGAPTVVAEPSGRVWINTTGNAGMATAGAGDVLTGLIAGLLAQGLKPVEAARLGVFVHGMSGDIAAEQKTEYCLIAGDLIDHLPQAYQTLMEERP
jgi:NAD(P)H-hydrate epimerase